VLSNCDKIILKANNKIVGEQTPDNGSYTFYGVPEKGGNPFDGGNCKYLKFHLLPLTMLLLNRAN
jgi:hypothetical protein